MKYILVLYLCSFLNTEPVVLQQAVSPIEYPTYYDCLSDGYIQSYGRILSIGVEQVNKQHLAIRFECRQVNNS